MCREHAGHAEGFPDGRSKAPQTCACFRPSGHGRHSALYLDGEPGRWDLHLRTWHSTRFVHASDAWQAVITSLQVGPRADSSDAQQTARQELQACPTWSADPASAPAWGAQPQGCSLCTVSGSPAWANCSTGRVAQPATAMPRSACHASTWACDRPLVAGASEYRASCSRKSYCEDGLTRTCVLGRRCGGSISGTAEQPHEAVCAGMMQAGIHSAPPAADVDDNVKASAKRCKAGGELEASANQQMCRPVSLWYTHRQCRASARQ